MPEASTVSLWVLWQQKSYSTNNETDSRGLSRMWEFMPETEAPSLMHANTGHSFPGSG